MYFVVPKKNGLSKNKFGVKLIASLSGNFIDKIEVNDHVDDFFCGICN